MTRKLFARSTFVALVALLAVGLGAQTSPWPFQSRSGSTSASASGPTRSVTVAFWNIQWFPGGRPDPTRAEETLQTNMVHADIARINPDVLGMSEVRDFKSAGLAVQPLRGFGVDVCANFPPREGQTQAQEIAIASRLRPVSAWAEEWKANGTIIPPRGFAFAAYQVAADRLLLVYAVHLKSNLGDVRQAISMREESVRQLRSHMDAMQNAYGKMGNIAWVIGGDWNTSPDDREFAGEKTLTSLIDSGWAWSWKNLAPSARVTHPAGHGFLDTTFDHILVRGAKIRKAWVVPCAPQSSDHRPIVATLDL